MQVSDDLFLGSAVAGGAGMVESSPGTGAGPTVQSVGVGPMGRIYLFDVVPLALNATNIAALQTTVGAGSLVLTAGTGTTVQVVNGETRIVLDTPRAVSLASTGVLNAITFTITGYDVYGQRMTVARLGPNNNTVNTLKAFKSIVSVTASAAVATNVSVGTTDILGLPVRVVDIGYIQAVKYGQVLLDDAGTAVAADVTSPATGATGDVRGTYTPSLATNGARRLIMSIALPAIASGPNATRVGAFGVTQA